MGGVRRKLSVWGDFAGFARRYSLRLHELWLVLAPQIGRRLNALAGGLIRHFFLLTLLDRAYLIGFESKLFAPQSSRGWTGRTGRPCSRDMSNSGTPGPSIEL